MYTQLSLLDLLPLSPLSPCPHSPIPIPEHDPYWDDCVGGQVASETHDAQKPDNCVGGQVAPDTLKIAPQHTHWLEEYWVERSSKKYYYWRYCWMEGRKIHRHYIGSVRSLKALGKYQAVEQAIALGRSSPQEIKQLIPKA